MRIKTIAVFSVVFVLTGCQHPMVWDKPGATNESFYKDRYACMQTSSAAAPSAPNLMMLSGANPMLLPVDMNQGNRNQLFDACMNSKGYQLIPTPK